MGGDKGAPAPDKKRIQFGPVEWAFVRQILAPHRWNIVLLLVFFGFQHSPVWLMPILVGRMVDLIPMEDPAERMHWLVVYTVITLAILLQNIPSTIRRQHYSSLISRGIGRDLRISICRQLQRLSLIYHDNTNVGRLQAKALRDVEQIENAPQTIALNVFMFVMQALVAIIAILWRAPMALIFFISLVPVSVWLQRYFSTKLGDMARNFRQSVEGMTSRLSDMLTMIPVARAHGAEEVEISMVSEKIDKVFQEGFRFDRLMATFGSTSWVLMQSIQTLFLTGAIYAAFQGHLSVGDVLMFNAFFIGLSGSLMVLLGTIPQLASARESVLSVLEVLNAPDVEENAGKPRLESVRGHFRFEDVVFRYPRAEDDAIRGLSLDVPAGTSVALIGGSGSGKSTILSLVLGFTRPTAGRILLDGRDLREVDMRSLRHWVGVVTQDTVFFSGSIYENINFGRSREADRGEAEEALRLANAWEFVAELPMGMDTRIGEGGVKLSGGQRQRIAIARALIRNPRILILDEATSALDLESELLVQQALERVMKGRTTFIVSHRLSTVRNADKIVILDRGRIATMGTHDELMAGENFYSMAVRQNVAFWN
jgi:ATP-binding cassette subfamily B protein